MRFGPADRLHLSREFVYLQRRGMRLQTRHFVLYAGKIATARSPEPAAPQNRRLGITVSRRIGGAVVRNRVKRRVRECFRLAMRPHLAQGVSVVVIALSGAGELSGAAINAELLTATLKISEKAASR